jgi:OST3 / OST6 family, transporter family
VPLVSQSANGKVAWFMKGQGQLGAEGFAAGIMYVAFAITCFALVNAPAWLGHLHKSDPMVYRLVCYLQLAGAAFLLHRIVEFYTMKTGYHLRYYLVDWLRGVRL